MGNNRWQETNEALDRTRIYIVGSNEWAEMMVAMYRAVEAALSIEAYNVATPILETMRAEIAAGVAAGWPDMYADQVAERERTYQFGEEFADGDNQVEPRFKNW